jgi:hypothetical protein
MVYRPGGCGTDNGVVNLTTAMCGLFDNIAASMKVDQALRLRLRVGLSLDMEQTISSTE